MSQLSPCPACRRHVRVVEPICPFCAAVVPPSAPRQQPVPRQRLGRAALLAAGTLMGAASCATDPPPLDAGSVDRGSMTDSGGGSGGSGSGGSGAGSGGSGAGTGGRVGGGSGGAGSGSGGAGSGSGGDRGGRGRGSGGTNDPGSGGTSGGTGGFTGNDGGAVALYGAPAAPQ